MRKPRMAPRRLVFPAFRQSKGLRRAAAILAGFLPLQQATLALGAPSGPPPVEVRGPTSKGREWAGMSMPAPKGVLIEDAGAPGGGWVYPDREQVVAFGGASVRIPPGAVDRPVRVTIRPLTRVSPSCDQSSAWSVRGGRRDAERAAARTASFA